jgi:hypothetical protein
MFPPLQGLFQTNQNINQWIIQQIAPIEHVLNSNATHWDITEKLALQYLQNFIFFSFFLTEIAFHETSGTFFFIQTSFRKDTLLPSLGINISS